MDNIIDIENRLKQLERKNSVFKRVSIFLSLFIIFGGLIGWQSAVQYFQTIETNKLVLKDANGKERAVLFVDEENKVRLRFKNSKDSVLLFLAATDDEGYIRLNEMGSNSKKSFSESSMYLGTNRIICYNNTDSVMFRISANNDFSWIRLNNYEDGANKNIFLYGGGLEMSDEKINNDNNLLYLGINNSPILRLGEYNSYSELLLSRSGLAIKHDSSLMASFVYDNLNDFSSIDLYDNPPQNLRKLKILGDLGIIPCGQLRQSFGIYKGNSSFQLIDRNGILRTAIGTTTTKNSKGQTITHPESSIFLFDENGYSIFNAPQE